MQLRASGTTWVWSGRGRLRTTLALALLLPAGLRANDPEPLHRRIDRIVDSSPVAPAAAGADDATFLRRIHLDLTGRIPGPAEALAFLEDASADKRARLVDRLLASPECARHLATTFDVWLMERRPDKHVKTDEWRAWLFAFFRDRRPYNELAREILGADGSEPLLRPAARFTLDRDVSPDALTRDVGRLFFGMDLECAQCHDHPRVDDYVQRDYYGLYAFVHRAYLFQPDPKKPAVVAEKGEGDVVFKSVFTKAEGSARPRLPDGAAIDEPAFPKGEEYQVKADPKDKSVRPVPKFSRRLQLARLTGEGAGRAFQRNIANRLWAHMTGRGLVEPLDLHHTDNPPVHPELLELLAAEFAAMKYDVRAFLREIALTRTYQRSIEMPAALAEQAAAVAPKLPALEAEARRLRELATKAEGAARKGAEEADAARKALAAAAAELARAEPAAGEAKKAAEAARKQLDARQDLRKAVSEAAEKASDARLAGDAELAAAAATFRARAGALAAEVEGLARDAKARAEALLAAEQAAGAAKARRAGAEEQLSARGRAQEQAEADRRSARVAASHAERVAADARSLAEYGALQSAAAAAKEGVRQLQAELAAAREAAAKGPAELPAREARAALAEAASTADEVAVQAAADAELAGAAAKVKGRRDRLGAEVAEARKAAAATQEAARRAAADLEGAERARADLASAKERIPRLEERLKGASAKAATDLARRNEAFAKLTASWTQRFAVGGLDPLTPEQICWSMMEATGLVEIQRAAARAEAAKKSVPAAEIDRFVEQFVYDKLKGHEAAFVKVFGAGPGQPQDEFYATVDQALFLANGGLVRGWLAPGAGNLADRLVKLEDPKALARELHLTVFSRLPTEAEAQDVARYVGARPQARLAAVQEMIWASLSSVEFRFKH